MYSLLAARQALPTVTRLAAVSIWLDLPVRRRLLLIVCIQIIILNTKFIIFGTQFIILNAEFIILNANRYLIVIEGASNSSF